MNSSEAIAYPVGEGVDFSIVDVEVRFIED